MIYKFSKIVHPREFKTARSVHGGYVCAASQREAEILADAAVVAAWPYSRSARLNEVELLTEEEVVKRLNTLEW